MLVAVAALAPVVQLVLRAGSDGWDQALRIIVRPRTAHLLGNTVVLAGVVGLATLLLGIGVAYASTRVRLPAPGCGCCSPACRWPCRASSAPSRGRRRSRG
ncbi:MAG: hypothetical protein R2719_13870 [Micropruina sp.]